VATCAIADAVDCAATLAVREKLPAPAAIGAMALAGGCTVVGLAAAAGLRN
jgi:hypothetical protein